MEGWIKKETNKINMPKVQDSPAPLGKSVWSVFIKCLEKMCGNITLNDDDSVCVKCGSKDTVRLKLTDKILKKSY